MCWISDPRPDPPRRPSRGRAPDLPPTDRLSAPGSPSSPPWPGAAAQNNSHQPTRILYILHKPRDATGASDAATESRLGDKNPRHGRRRRRLAGHAWIPSRILPSAAIEDITEVREEQQRLYSTTTSPPSPQQRRREELLLPYIHANHGGPGFLRPPVAGATNGEGRNPRSWRRRREETLSPSFSPTGD